MTGLLLVVGLVLFPAGWSSPTVRTLCGKHAQSFLLDHCSLGKSKGQAMPVVRCMCECWGNETQGTPDLFRSVLWCCFTQDVCCLLSGSTVGIPFHICYIYIYFFFIVSNVKSSYNSSVVRTDLPENARLSTCYFNLT